jgi:lactam utilization protein B
MRSSGCPWCRHSIGERIILDWFKKRNIEIEHHFSYPDLLGLGGRPLEFDFRIKRANSLIEYDGEQHFRPVRFNGISEEKAKEQFKKLQYHDTLKNQYCIEKNIPLLRINYKEFNNIPEILTNSLSN